MKCINCGKVIPSSSIECPNCNKDPYIKDVTDFGTIDNVGYGSDMDIKINVEEKKKEKKSPVKLIIIVVVLLVVGLAVFIFSGKNKTCSYESLNKFLDELSETLVNRIDNVYSGTYNMDIKINKERYIFDGKYSYDLGSRYVNIDGHMDDPRKKDQQAVIADVKDLDFNFIENDLESYITSKMINSSPILLPLDNYSLYVNKKVDYVAIIESITDALKKTFKVSNFNTKKVSYKYKNENINATKTTLIIDSQSKYSFLKSFLGELKEDSSFLSELSKVTKMSEDAITQFIDNYISNAKYGVNEEMDEIRLNVYSKGTKVYEINYNNQYTLKIVDDSYSFTYKDKAFNELNFKVSKKSEEHQDYIEYIYDFEYSYLDTNITGILKLKDDLDPKLNKKDIENPINLNDLTAENRNSIKERLVFYLKNADWTDTLYDKLKMRCTKGLDCTCEENVCTCLYQKRMITCDYDLVK